MVWCFETLVKYRIDMPAESKASGSNSKSKNENIQENKELLETGSKEEVPLGSPSTDDFEILPDNAGNTVNLDSYSDNMDENRNIDNEFGNDNDGHDDGGAPLIGFDPQSTVRVHNIPN